MGWKSRAAMAARTEGSGPETTQRQNGACSIDAPACQVSTHRSRWMWPSPEAQRGSGFVISQVSGICSESRSSEVFRTIFSEASGLVWGPWQLGTPLASPTPHAL